MTSWFEYDGYYPVFNTALEAKNASSDGTIFIIRDNQNNRDLYVALIDNASNDQDIVLTNESKHMDNETKDMTDTRVNSYNETILNENSVGNIETTKEKTIYTVYHHSRPNVFSNHS